MLHSIAFFLLVTSNPQPPLAEQYLHAGQHTQGILVLERHLRQSPDDDQARMGLGVLRLTRGVERMCQAFYTYGLRNKGTGMLFIRIPIPNNPDPQPVSYRQFRAIFAEFQRDLMDTERTLAEIKSDQVKLPLRLAPIKLDIDGNGDASDSFLDILHKLLGGRLELLAKNPEFRVHFDRGDVPWLRAYCHLMAGMLDIYLAIDTEPEFHQFAIEYFPRVKPVLSDAELKRLQDRNMSSNWTIRFQERERLSSMRNHLVAVCQLNRECWRFIRAETDDDYEWLPHPKQKGVFEMPVTDAMIYGWVAMMERVEDLLEGRTVIKIDFIVKKQGYGLNMKALLEDPPAEINFMTVMQDGPADKYLVKDGKPFDVDRLFAVLQLFDSPLRMGYMAWFN
jgi:hypothetical protein